jgi:hypothetical protein
MRQQQSLAPYEHPVSPIRDDSKLSPGEDLDREPDGFPHRQLGVLVLTAVVLAVVVFIAWASGRYAIAIVTLATIPFIIIALQRNADRWRDADHPSR